MERIRGLLNLKVLVGGGIASMCLFATLLVLLSTARKNLTSEASGTAVLYVIAAPSATSLLPLPSVTPSPTPTQPQSSSNSDGTVAIGVYVQITGTGGDGLRLRSDPGLSGTVRFLAIDGEVFEVLNGPTVIDGYTWWLLQAPYDPNVQGWAVNDFFTVVQNP